MAQLIFYLVLFLSYVSFSTAYTAYVPPSIVLNNKYIVDVEHEIRVGFRLFDASAINKDSKVIKYQNLQYTTNTPNVKFPRVVGNKNKLFFYGVNGNDVFETAIMFSFDINKKVWNELKDTNMPSHLNPNQEENFVGPDSDGNAYLLYNDNNIMLSFNTETLEWNEYLIQSFIPTGYAYYTWYTATILPDGNIAYIGGKFSNGTNYIDAPMNQFYTYNTKIHVWAAKSTIGTTPGARNCHSASLTSDGRIIIYGGVNANEQPATPSLAVLDINKYEWSTPIEENPIGPVYLAPSVIINDLMFLYLGVNVTSAVPNVFSKVYVLDTSTYAWSSLDPVVANSNDNIYSSGNNQITGGNANKNDLTMTLIIILIVISSILTLTILGVTFYKLYRSRRSRFSNQISPKVIDNSQQRSQV